MQMTVMNRNPRTRFALSSYTVAREELAAQRPWRLSVRRAAAPITPLEADVLGRGWSTGFRRAASAYGLPALVESRRIDGFLYYAVERAYTSEGERQDMLASAFEALGGAATSARSRWEAELLPEMERHIAALRSFDLGGASLTALIAHFDQSLRRLDRVWEIYYTVALPASMAKLTFADAYTHLFGARSANEAAGLLQGIDGPIEACERAFSRMSLRAAGTPAVRDALRWCADHEVIEALGGSEAGRAFLREFEGFLEVYGRRADGQALVEAPLWLKDPRPLIRRLRERALAPASYAADDHVAALDDARWRLEEEFSERLMVFPRRMAEQVSAMLRTAQQLARLEQEAEFWLRRYAYELRLLLLELGRRFTNGEMLAEAADVVYLDLREIRQTAETLPWVDRRQRVERRKAELHASRAHTPAEQIGPVPVGAAAEDVLSRLVGQL
jgi:hypothetical protein